MKEYIRTEYITDFMQKQKLSKKAFSELCGITVYTLNRILLNNVSLRISPYVKIAKAIKVRLSDLFL